MKKIVFMLIPLLVILLAFSPVNSFTVKGVVKESVLYLNYETLDSQLYSRLIDGAGFYRLPFSK